MSVCYCSFDCVGIGELWFWLFHCFNAVTGCACFGYFVVFVTGLFNVVVLWMIVVCGLLVVWLIC